MSYRQTLIIEVKRIKCSRKHRQYSGVTMHTLMDIAQYMGKQTTPLESFGGALSHKKNLGILNTASLLFQIHVCYPRCGVVFCDFHFRGERLPLHGCFNSGNRGFAHTVCESPSLVIRCVLFSDPFWLALLHSVTFADVQQH